jgi:hypothetical protein
VLLIEEEEEGVPEATGTASSGGGRGRGRLGMRRTDLCFRGWCLSSVDSTGLGWWGLTRRIQRPRVIVESLSATLFYYFHLYPFVIRFYILRFT